MGKLLFILAALFVALFVLVKLLEGRAKPLSDEQQVRLRKWITIAVFAMLILALLQAWLGGRSPV